MLGISEVKKITKFLDGYSSGVLAIQGCYVVDAKSMLGLFSLDLTQPVTIYFRDYNVDEIVRFESFCRMELGQNVYALKTVFV